MARKTRKVRGGMRNAAINQVTRRLFLEQFPQTVLHTLNDAESGPLKSKLSDRIPDSSKRTTDICDTTENYKYVQVLKAFSNDWTYPLFLFGGAVRDYAQGGFKDISQLNDIDINYLTNWE